MEKILNKINTIEGYINHMTRLANIDASYKMLDKLHYLVNEKLNIKSDLVSILVTELSNYVSYCACCGKYLHHNNRYREEWYLNIDNKNYLIHRTPWIDDIDDDLDEYCIDCEQREIH